MRDAMRCCLPSRRTHRLCAIAGILAVFPLLFLVSGCDQGPEPIEVSKIPKQPPESLLPGDQRLVAAMVPRGQKVWFFKIMGPEDAVSTVADQVKDFVSDVKFNDEGEPILDELPEGWKRTAASMMRFATININTEDKQLDFSISTLAAPEEGWDPYVKLNVDRWRKQVGLGNGEAPWAGAVEMTVAAAAPAAEDQKSVWADFTGMPPEGSGQSMMPPFMQGMMGAGGGGSVAPPGAGQGSSPPPSSPAEQPNPNLGFDQPESWRPGKMNTMREAAFNLGPSDREAELTVMTLGGGLEANVSRWVRQVMGQAPSDEELKAIMEGKQTLTVSGREAFRFIISGPDSATQAIDGTIIPLADGQSKFIKVTGPPDTVKEEQENTAAFLKSLKF